MAKIPLRSYIKDIENLIERGEVDKAISHAKNILKTFPKHIETYRLLGKAYLESQRYSEATDILQRVLSVVPDDFVSQIGVSIIREDEGNLDAAIWHMERAYEVQPFNPAVQEELRRLYGRRDGIEPPKIRLTRGALVRMYARGELYPQAIAETRAALAEDSQRLDLQVLLARLYFLNGQKVEATEVCSSLISKLPYCYEANLILTDVLPGTSRAEDARTFQQRLYALDPYAAYLSPSAITADQVPDQAVMVEPFLFEEALESQDQRPDWARNVGVEWQETEEEHLPDWLNTLAPTDQAPSASSQTVGIYPAKSGPPQPETTHNEPGAGDQDGVPDWMKSAGWAKTDRSADEIMKEQLQLAADRPDSDEEAAPGEIPDWLQTMAPPVDAESQAREQDRLDLLESILPVQAQDEAPLLPDSQDSDLDWLTSTEALAAGAVGGLDLFGDDEPAQTAADNNAVETPAWLSGLGSEQATSQAESETPDWLSSLGGDESMRQAPVEASGSPEPGVADWLSGMGSADDLLNPESPTDTGPDWLTQLGAAETAPADESAYGNSAGLPDWMQPVEPDPAEDSELSASTSWMSSFEDERAAADLPSAEQPSSTDEAIPDWLQGADIDTIIPAPRMPGDADLTVPGQLETPPTTDLPVAEGQPTVDTVRGYEAPVAEDQPAAQIYDAQTSEPPQTAAPDFSDMDAAMAWLESLAAKHGADEATLVTRPEDRLDTPPDWVKQEAASAEAGLVKLPELAADELPAAQELPAVEAALPDWLQSADMQLEGAQPDAGAPDQAPDLSDWMASLGDETQHPVNELPAVDEADLADFAVGALADDAPAIADETPAVEADLPDWLIAAQAEANEQTADVNEFLPEAQERSAAQEQPAYELPAAQELPAAETAALDNAAPAGEAAMPDFSDMDAAMAWLESLAAKHGADEATLATRPEDRLDTPPDWVKDEIAQGEKSALEMKAALEQPVQPEANLEQSEWNEPRAELEAEALDALPSESVPVSTASSDQPSGEMDFDATFAWLESLAARQGAEEGSLTTTPDDNPVEAPEWVQNIAAEESSAAETTRAASDPMRSEMLPGESAGWLAQESGEIEPDFTSEVPAWYESGPEDDAQFDQTAPRNVTSTPAEWLPEMNATPLAPVEPAAEVEELPAWLQQVAAEEQAASSEPKMAPKASLEDWLHSLESDSAAPTADYITEDQQAILPDAWQQEEEQALPVVIDPSLTGQAALSAAQASLNRGRLDPALEAYNRFIANDEFLEEVIHDLRDALYRYPVDISVWQSLGDAFARNNQLQEALDAYTKAEELLR